MPNYLVKHKDVTKHYFYIPNLGLSERVKHRNHWQNHKPIYHDCSGVFSVFSDNTGDIHIICMNKKNELVYLFKKQDKWQSHIVARLKENLSVSDIVITKTQIGLNILYTAENSEETFLVHCLLGNNAMPNTLDKISSKSFFIFKNRVYYQNSEGILGYRNFSDGKPDTFNRLVKGAEFPYLLSYSSGDIIAYKKDDYIYFQNRPVQKDQNASFPILSTNNNQLLLMWQNGDFIRYIISTDEGKTWSSVMQFVNPGKRSQLYHVINGSEHHMYFGNHSHEDLHIYGKENIFEPSAPSKKPDTSSLPDPNQLTKLKILIELQKKEIIALKSEIIKLGKIINSFSSDNSEENSIT